MSKEEPNFLKDLEKMKSGEVDEIIHVVGHSEMHPNKHEVLNLEQTMKIDVHSHPEHEEFETWVCMHRKCNYLEYRLKEGHREDR